MDSVAMVGCDQKHETKEQRIMWQGHSRYIDKHIEAECLHMKKQVKF